MHGRSKLQPVKRVARTFKDHLCGLIAFFANPVTNAVAKGLNSKIQVMTQAAYGFRSFAAYGNLILLYCEGLVLRPRLSQGCAQGN